MSSMTWSKVFLKINSFKNVLLLLLEFLNGAIALYQKKKPRKGKFVTAGPGQNQVQGPSQGRGGTPSGLEPQPTMTVT